MPGTGYRLSFPTRMACFAATRPGQQKAGVRAQRSRFLDFQLAFGVAARPT